MEGEQATAVVPDYTSNPVGTNRCTIASRVHVAPSAILLRLNDKRRARIELNTRFITLEIA